MTRDEHKKIAASLKGKATKLLNKSKKAATLAEKIRFRAERDSVLTELDIHKLNFFELTK